jgi:lipid II:glycine glycyltransferase (peptidoglycan interpeptide bridge formation enzyme)
MEIKEIKNKEVWEDFLLEGEEKTFLQSWNWGEFQKMMGNKIWRLGIYEISNLKSRASIYGSEGEEENEILFDHQISNLIGVALAIKIRAKRGTFMFLPHGPIIKSQISNLKSQILEFLLMELKKIAKKENCSFIRIAPIWERNEENREIFKEMGFREAPIHIHPELTWELDIRPSEDELLTGMRKTTRYLIRQAQKNKEIEVYQSKKIEDIEIFNNLYQATVDRHHFVPFSLEYLKNEFLAFSPDNEISIFLGKYKNEIVSSGIFIFWQNIAFYHHGASSLKYPKIPVSYLLLWEAIREAKRRGCQKFNFWGIADQNQKSKIKNQKFENKKHPWWGLTLFKMGFGGYKKEYLKTQDFPLSKKYWLTYFFEKLRKIKRGL